MLQEGQFYKLGDKRAAISSTANGELLISIYEIGVYHEEYNPYVKKHRFMTNREAAQFLKENGYKLIEEFSDQQLQKMEDKIQGFRFGNFEIFFKITGFLQQNWCYVVELDGKVAHLYVDDAGQFFDYAEFANMIESREWLNKRKFDKYTSDISFTSPPLVEESKEKLIKLRPIYSRGLY